MTRSDRLYYRDSYLTEFTATVVSAHPGAGQTEVVLDRTAFYPEGGGQPADSGLLGSARVLGVQERDGAVVHLVEGPPIEGEVAGRVDWKRRFDHMQQHSGQHLLSQAFERLLGAKTVSFHMGPDVSSVDLAVPSLAPDQVEAVETLANRVVFENRSVLVYQVDSSELVRLDLRKGSERTGEVRVVEIQDFDAIPCGGTHVRYTGEIGLAKVVRWAHRGGNIRVEFLCGARALSDYRAKNEAMVHLAATLSVRDGEVREAVERRLCEVEEARRQVGHLRRRLLGYEAEELARQAVSVGRVALITAYLEGYDPDDLKHLATTLTSTPGRVALLAAGNGDASPVVFARSEDVGLDAGALFRQVCLPLGGRGGGRPNLAQGGVPAAEGARAALDEAAKALRSLLAV